MEYTGYIMSQYFLWFLIFFIVRKSILFDLSIEATELVITWYLLNRLFMSRYHQSVVIVQEIDS